jgi:thiol:disulfide interchange protein
MLRSLFTLLFSAFSFIFFSQIENPEDKVKVSFSVEQNGCEAFVIANVKMIKGWHIVSHVLPEGSYLFPTDMKLTKNTSFKLLGKLIEPKPIVEKNEEIDDIMSYHKDNVIIKQKIEILNKNDFQVKGVFTFQTCDDFKCLPPYDIPFTVNLKGCETGTDLNATTTSSNEISEPEKTAESTVMKPGKKVVLEKTKVAGKSMWVIFILSFLSGFAALLTPCVFPMIPMTVSFFTKQSKTKAQGVRNAIFYGLSIIVIYVTLGTVVTAAFGYDALNALSTNVYFNLIFFALLIVFAISFLGAFEITLPNSWLNKADQASDKGGIIGIFFMALALALVSFSCTGPIVGTLLVESATIGGMAPFIGMFGFSLALALPFTLFAAFPGWLNSLPKSGGWLNTVKVVLGFLELALAFKFLSNADLVVQAHLLEREVFLAIWIGVFLTLALYLFGFIRLPHDSPIEKLSVGRTLLGVTTLIFVIYLIPGMWGAQLKLISGFPPPMSYSENPRGFHGGTATVIQENLTKDMHLGPQNIMVFEDLDKAQAYADSVGKPLFVDFTGHACVNCRKMEETVWGQPEILPLLRDKVVIVSLYVDDKRPLPKSEQKRVEYAPGKTKMLTEIGHKWSYLQATRYKKNTQPYYRILGKGGDDLSNGSADYENHRDPKAFKNWLLEGLNDYKKN